MTSRSLPSLALAVTALALLLTGASGQPSCAGAGTDLTPPVSQCSSLDQATCIATPECVAMSLTGSDGTGVYVYCAEKTISPGADVGPAVDAGPACEPVRCQPGCNLTTDKWGCSACDCSPVCGAPVCDNVCPNGRVRDSMNCETCACIEKDGPVCPPGSTRDPSTGKCLPVTNCPPNSIPDASGQCVPVNVCPLIACPAIACPNGHLIDANGCDTCQCAPTRCADGTPVDPTTGRCMPAQPSCKTDSDCAAGLACLPDPTDPCNTGNVQCFAVGRMICQPKPACGPGLSNVNGVCTQVCADGTIAKNGVCGQR